MNSAEPKRGREKKTREGAYTGRTIQGRYELGDRIGAGGMGQVYEAVQQPLGRRVVVKMLHDRSLDDPRQRERFEREAITMSRLDHPNIVKVYDFGVDRGIDYIVMEYVEGVTLQGVVERAGALDLEQFTRYAVRILRAVSHAHEQGIIHRDLKPSNIMVALASGRTDVIKVLDFGLVKMADDEDLTQITRNGELVGSAPFLSPERILGKPVDARVDVYALGVIFYYMLSGTLPFTASSPMRLMQKHVKDRPPSLAERIPAGRRLPSALMKLVHQCLEKDPDARPSGVLEILSILRALSRDEEVEALEVLEEMDARPRRRKIEKAWVAGVVAAAVGAVAALVALSIWGPNPGVEQPTEEEVLESDRVTNGSTGHRDHKGSIAVEATPTGAQLYLEGERIGSAPLQIDLSEGEHALEVRAEGHKPKVVPVEIERDRRTRVHVVLEREK